MHCIVLVQQEMSEHIASEPVHWLAACKRQPTACKRRRLRQQLLQQGDA